MQNIISIDVEAWGLVKDGVTIDDLTAPTDTEKKMQALDRQVWVFITNHMTCEQYDLVKNIPSAKEVRDYLEKVGEGVTTHKDA